MENDNSEKPVDFVQNKDVFGLDKNENSLESGSDEAPPQKVIDEINLFEGVEFPSLLQRVKAVFVDVLVMLLVFALTAQIIGIVGEVPDWVRASVLLFMVYLYEPVCVSLFGGTLGHFLIGLRVKQAGKPDKKLSILVAMFRFFMKTILGWISFLTIGSNNHKRAIHDFASGSIVLPKAYFETSNVSPVLRGRKK
jgi:uncharacterized RDD family membrane protein YckC